MHRRRENDEALAKGLGKLGLHSVSIYCYAVACARRGIGGLGLDAVVN